MTRNVYNFQTGRQRSIHLLFLIILAGITLHSTAWGMEVETREIKVILNEATGRIDILPMNSPAGIKNNIVLGTVIPKDSEETLEFSRKDFPDMKITRAGRQRMNLEFPLANKGITFYLALELNQNTLMLTMDTNPIAKSRPATSKPPEAEETLALLHAPTAYREVRLLPDVIRLEKNENGQLVVPYQEGTLIDFSPTLTKSRDFDLYQNNGLTMPFWGVTTAGHSEVAIIDYLYAHLLYEPDSEMLRLIPRFFADPKQVPIRMQVKFLGENQTYIDVAQAYRQYLKERGELPSLAKKLRRHPQLIHLLEGANVKFPIIMKHEQRPNTQGVTPPPVAHNYQTFEDVVQVLEVMKAHGVKRLMAVWWGWGKEGYDRLHPDLLPPNPERGGAPVFVAMNRRIDEMGFLAGFHDNYTDIYEAAPSFEEGRYCLMGPDGKNRMGGFWAGGQCWLLCSTEGVLFAKRNFEEMKDLGPIHACFIDVLTAAPLFDCYAITHPHTKWGDMQNKRAMMALVADYFGVMGSEHGFSWGADLCDYFEGITNDPHNTNEWFQGYGTSVPLFAAVYHDAVVQYMYQDAAVNPRAPDRLLFNLRAGGASYFNVVRRQYEDAEWKDYFLRSYRASADTIKRTWRWPLTEHRFLSEDRRVEQCRYGKDVFIVINRSDSDFRGSIDRTLLGKSAVKIPIHLAPHGFLVSAPDYAALNGSAWGGLEWPEAGWFTFEAQEGKTLARSKMIQVNNYGKETALRDDPSVVLQKGEGMIPRQALEMD